MNGADFLGFPNLIAQSQNFDLKAYTSNNLGLGGLFLKSLNIDDCRLW
jgi:hypothetical protein